MSIRSRIIAIIGALGLTLALYSVDATAQIAQPAINAIAITTYPPFEFKDPATNKLMGFDIDLIEAIATKMGTKVNWIESSWNQMISMGDLKTKRADITVGMGDTQERRESANFVDYVFDAQSVYTLRSNTDRVPNLLALCGKSVAVARGSRVYIEALKKFNEDSCISSGKPELTTVLTEGPVENRLQMVQGRVAASMLGLAALGQLNSTEADKYVAVGAPLVLAPIGFAFAKDNVPFGESVKGALNELIADGTYDKILRKWKMPDSTHIKRAMINMQP
ncbi:transporter substrate-binding domain-containing protein [Bradyrhizobium brasilense]|uniref:transporter substrate-binding domain-containing protein n=1 Tax=Bradyrhizobium brasilense TaxID=1419277 RepID=UPI0014569DD3|nr:transporter substrate-binding domain-containing protein [Bradyrhizobium brasilense]NLS75307.1 transporter substrate-binding domain-containing protein [Bradyrhizobium brasilense]